MTKARFAELAPARYLSDLTPEPDSPFHILLIGDFSGRASRGLVEPLAGRTPVEVDVETLETFPRVFATELQVEDLTFILEDLDSFLPEQILAAQPQLKQAGADVAARLRSVLHHACWQTLESSWRGLAWLVRHAAGIPRLKIFVLDVSKAELVADLVTAGSLESTELFRRLVARPAKGEPWAVVGLDCYFRAWLDDMELLSSLASIADVAGAPMLAGADPSLVGIKSPEQAADPSTWCESPIWQQLRRKPVARRIGLTLPRFLLRAPYRDRSFEEWHGAATYENLLWGNSIYAAIGLIAQSFRLSGWEMYPGQFRQINGLPVFHGKAPLELPLSEEAAGTMLAYGLMPFLCRDSHVPRLALFQSAADPPEPLEGRWR